MVLQSHMPVVRLLASQCFDGLFALADVAAADYGTSSTPVFVGQDAAAGLEPQVGAARGSRPILHCLAVLKRAFERVAYPLPVPGVHQTQNRFLQAPLSLPIRPLESTSAIRSSMFSVMCRLAIGPATANKQVSSLRGAASARACSARAWTANQRSLTR